MATIVHLTQADKGAASGVAPLDTNAKVPVANLPVGTSANEIVQLDSSGKIPTSVIPDGIDEIQHANGVANFPATGTADVIYI